MKFLPVAFVLMVALVVAWYGGLLFQTISLRDDTEVYDIPVGTTVTRLAQDLYDREIITVPPLVFRIYARLTEHEGQLKAGEYRIEDHMTAMTLLALFRSGKVIEHEIKFIEGWTFAEWRFHLHAQTLIQNTLESQDDDDIMTLLGKPGLHPEGQFFPDTYRYVRGETDMAILTRAHVKMTTILEEEWARRTTNLYQDPYEALVLSSIVEKESAWEPDRPRVAGVFTNRLREGMRLQSDPTVIYGIPAFGGDLKRSDLASTSAYNTYQIKGLPPTPICNPGLSSIRAVLNPDSHGYFYFVARGDGTSEFSATLAEHNAAVTRYQKSGRVGDYRSSPPSP